MGDLSATLKTELQKRGAKTSLWLLQIAWWDGTELYSDAGVSSRTDGFYKPRVASWGELAQGGIDPQNNLQDTTFSVTITDPDRALRNRLGRREPLFNTTCTLYLAGSETVPKASWYTAFAGYLDSISSSDRGTWQLSFRGLNVFAQPVRLRTIDLVEFPNADPAAVGRTIPRIWGYHIGTGYSGENTGGACPTFYTDTTTFQYVVAEGWVDVLCVYKDGVAVNFLTANFAITHANVGAALYTRIDFVGTQGSSTITCDVKGYDTNGDGTGTLIEAPLAVIDDVLTKTLSPTGTSILDISNSATVPSPRLHAYGGYYLGDQAKTGVQLIADLARSFNLYPWLKGDGTVAFGQEMSWEGESTDPTSAPWFRYQHDEDGDIGQESSGQDLASKQSITYGTRSTGGDMRLVAGDGQSQAGEAAIDEGSAPFLDVLSETWPDAVLPGNLKSWVEAQTLAQVEHNDQLTKATKAPYHLLHDLGSTQHDWTVAGTVSPFLRGEASGLPAIQPTSQIITGPPSNQIFSSTGFTFFLVFKLRSVAAAGADGTVTNDNILDAQGSDCVQLTASTVNGNLTLRTFDGSANLAKVPYTLGQYMVVCGFFGGANVYLGINEVRLAKMGTVAGGTLSGLGAGTAAIGGRTTSANFSSINFAAAAFWNIALKENERLQVLQYFTSRYLRYSTAGIARSVAALRMLGRRNLRSKVTMSAPLEWTDAAMLSQINIQDPDVPGSLGDQPWQRRPAILGRRSLHPASSDVVLELSDGQDLAPCLWISARADRAVSGDRDRLPGVCVFPNVHLESSFNDATAIGYLQTPLESPWSDQFLIQTERGRPMVGGPLTVPQGGISSLTAAPIRLPGGIWIQTAHVNSLPRSSFISGLTGLTTAGGGVAVDTSDLLFPSALTPNSIKLTVTGGADQVLTWNTAPQSLTSVPWYVSLDFKCDSAKYLMLRLNSTTPNLDYNPATGLFDQAPPFYFQCDAWQGHTASKTRGRFIARTPGTGAAAGGLAASVKLLGSHGTGSIAHVYHLQMAACNDASSAFLRQSGIGSRILTDAAAASANALGSLRVWNDTAAGGQVFPNSRGTMLATICLLWNAADLGTIGNHPVFDLPYDPVSGAPNHYFRLVFENNGGSPRLAFRVKGGGGTEVISAVSLTGYGIGDVVRVACRWTSASGGELGLTANTCSVFIKKLPQYDQAGRLQVAGGVMAKGNDVVCTKPTAAATALHIGGLISSVTNSVECLDSILMDFLVVPRCMPDDEIDKRA